MITSTNNARCYDYNGLSTDIKPMKAIGNGSTFFEMDTSKVFMFNAATQEWVEIE